MRPQDELLTHSSDTSQIGKELRNYHEQVEIAPNRFRCFHWKCCQHFAGENELQKPTDHVAASQHYQDRRYLNHDIPRLVVVSLSAPAIDHEAEPTESKDIGLHWRRTLATVRSLLDPFLEDDLPEPARNADDESVKQVERLFIHLRTAKCSSHASEEAGQIYEHCGRYLGDELRIAQPDVVVTQGRQAEEQMKKHFLNLRRIGKCIPDEKDTEGKFCIDIFEVGLNGDKALWIPLYHPSAIGNTFNNQAGIAMGSDSERGKSNNAQSARRDNLVACGGWIKSWMAS